MEILYTRETSDSVEEVGKRLETATPKHKFGVINIVDLRAKMHAKGVAFSPACLVYEVCNPHRAKDVLENMMAISTVLPCRISIYEEAGKTKVTTLLPTQALGMFAAAGLDAVAESVEKDLIAIIDDAIDMA